MGNYFGHVKFVSKRSKNYLFNEENELKKLNELRELKEH